MFKHEFTQVGTKTLQVKISVVSKSRSFNVWSRAAGLEGGTKWRGKGRMDMLCGARGGGELGRKMGWKGDYRTVHTRGTSAGCGCAHSAEFRLPCC